MYKKSSRESRFTFHPEELESSPRLISPEFPKKDDFSKTIKTKDDPRIRALSRDPSTISLEVRGTACPVYSTFEPSENKRTPSQLSKTSQRKSNSPKKPPNVFTRNSNLTNNAEHANSVSQQPDSMSQVTSKTQKELYKAELAKVWDIVYKERQKVAKAKKQVKSLTSELQTLKSFIGNQETWFNEREAEIAMKYKAKKESLRA